MDLNLKVFGLKSGISLVGNVLTETGGIFKVNHVRHLFEVQQGLAFVQPTQFCSNADEVVLTLKEDDYFFVAEPNEQIVSYLTKQFSTIQVVEKPGLILPQ